MRLIILGALILTIASAFVLYSSNYDTRQFEARVAEQERAIDKARSDISVLKAERAHLGRPSASSRWRAPSVSARQPSSSSPQRRRTHWRASSQATLAAAARRAGN